METKTGQFQVQVCLVTERAISWQMHLSLVLKAFGPLISLMSWERTNRNAANRHLELPGKIWETLNVHFANVRFSS